MDEVLYDHRNARLPWSAEGVGVWANFNGPDEFIGLKYASINLAVNGNGYRASNWASRPIDSSYIVFVNRIRHTDVYHVGYNYGQKGP